MVGDVCAGFLQLQRLWAGLAPTPQHLGKGSGKKQGRKEGSRGHGSRVKEVKAPGHGIWSGRLSL